MTDNQTIIPFHRSFLLGKIVHIDKLAELTSAELELLNVETLASRSRFPARTSPR